MKTKISTQLAHNILANYFSVLWIGGLTVVLMPAYFKILGQHQWPIVALCITIQGFFTLLDAGLGQIMPKQTAQCKNDKEKLKKYFLIFSRIYLALALLGFMVGQIGAKWVASGWVLAERINTNEIEMAIRIVLVQFLFQFANNAHLALWNGMELQKAANARQCMFATAKHFLALIVLIFIERSASAYLISFSLIASIEFLSNRAAINKLLVPTREKIVIRYKELGDITSQIAKLGGGVLIGMLVTQIDRLILSRSMPLADYGIYMMIANFGSALLQLQYPLMRAFFPKIAKEAGVPRHAVSAIKTLTIAVIVACVLPCILVVLFAPSILGLWIGAEKVVPDSALTLRLMATAVAINSIYNTIYLRIVSHDIGFTILYINLFALVTVLFIISLGVAKIGMVAGGIIWVVNSLVQITFGIFWVNRLNNKNLFYEH